MPTPPAKYVTGVSHVSGEGVVVGWWGGVFFFFGVGDEQIVG